MSLALLAPEILQSLPPLLQQQDVSNLSKTCKRMRSAMLGYLYKSIQWRWNTGGETRGHPEVLSTPPIHLLLRSLMRNPGLGNLVERIQFEGPKFYMRDIGTASDYFRRRQAVTASIWTPDGPTGLTTSEIESAMQWVRRFQLKSPGVFREALLRGDIDAYVCIVIAFLPDLRSLWLSGEFVLCNSEFLGSLFERALQTSLTEANNASPSDAIPQYFSLREVKLGYRSKDSRSVSNKSRLEDMYSFFYLPSLEHLTIHLPKIANFNWPDDLSKQTPMKTLASLKLPACEMKESALEQLLASKPPLKKLVYKYSCAEVITYARGSYFNLSTLSRAFSHVQSTVESLKFHYDHQTPDADGYACYCDAHGLFLGIMAPFSHFPCLTHLEIPFIALTGWKVVPRNARPLAEMLSPSIRHLCLTDNLAWWEGSHWEVRYWLERLRDLLATREESMGEIAGGLKIIEVKRENTVLEWESKEEEEFRWLGRRYGVETLFSGAVTPINESYVER